MQVCYKNFIWFIIGLFFIGCDSGDDLTMGSEFIDSTTRIYEVDSFYVELSTVIVDSLITSEAGVVLVGYYEDGEFGKITAESFTQIGLPDNILLEEDEDFDSITISLPYNNYFYGDTNQHFELDLYLLNEEMDYGDALSFYNTSEINYGEDLIGQIELFPRPSRDSIIEFRINDSFGQELFDKLKNYDEEIQSLSNFQKYIYGLALVPKKSESSSIIGFDQSNTSLKLYTNRKSVLEEEQEQVIYTFGSYGNQFNHIESDRSGTFLENINSQSQYLNSVETDNLSFIQGGVGILTKIRFPYLNSLLFDSNNIILAVELILKPDKESYESDFPESLYLYASDEYHEFDIAEEQNLVSYSVFTLDEEYHENTQYSFDITGYFEELISGDYIDNEQCLFAAINSSEFSSTLKRLVLTSDQSPENRPILKITYLEN